MSAEKFYKVLTGIFVGIILAGAVGYYFASAALDRKLALYSERLSEEIIAQDLSEQLQKLRNEYEEAVKNIDSINAVLPDQKLQSEIVSQIIDISNRVGIELTALRFEATSDLPGITSQTQEAGVSGALALPLTFRTSGSYAQLQQFLVEIENLQRSTQVSSLNVSKPTSGETTDELIFNMILDIHIEKVSPPQSNSAGGSNG